VGLTLEAPGSNESEFVVQLLEDGDGSLRDVHQLGSRDVRLGEQTEKASLS